MGHRWGAAFPVVSSSLHTLLDHENYQLHGKKNSYVDSKLKFAACGDYFHEKLSGRVEGAAISGQVAALSVLSILGKTSQK